MGRLLDQPGYGKFWIADTVSQFGSNVTVVALPALAILTMKANDVEVGVLRAAQWLPYLFFGLLAGVVVGRYPRKPILIGTDLARAVMLGLIPVLSLAGLLSVPLLAGIVAVFGVMSLVYDAAHQSFFPRLVPADLLTSAHARMGQSRSLAESTGPLLGGGLVAAVGAQLAMLVDAFSYLISGLLLISVRSPEPLATTGKRHLLGELREGVRWVYWHPMLGPMALTNHVRFAFAGMTSTVFLLFFVREISAGLSEKEIGIGTGRLALRRRPHDCRDASARAVCLGLAGHRPGRSRGLGDGRGVTVPSLCGAWRLGPQRDGLSAGGHPGSVAGQDECHDPVVQLGNTRRRGAVGRRVVTAHRLSASALGRYSRDSDLRDTDWPVQLPPCAAR